MDDEMHRKPTQALNGSIVSQIGIRRGAESKAASDPIAVGLRQLFATVADEAVPDEFMALLDRIDANERLLHSEAEKTVIPATGNGGTGK